MKFVLNKDYGGFGLSKKAEKILRNSGDEAFERNDPRLVQVVEELGEDASTCYSDLRVIEVPDETTDYYIHDYDGIETLIYVVDGKIYFA